MDALIAEGLLPLAVRIDTVRPDPGNPREGDVDAVKRSLVRFGQRKPIVARADGLITAGHHVHAAAIQLGWNEVAVVFCADDDDTAKAFALADNRASDLGRYNTALLTDRLAEVAAADAELLAAASYSPDDIEALIALNNGPPPKPDIDDFDDPDDDDMGSSGDHVCPACGFSF